MSNPGGNLTFVRLAPRPSLAAPDCFSERMSKCGMYLAYSGSSTWHSFVSRRFLPAKRDERVASIELFRLRDCARARS